MEHLYGMLSGYADSDIYPYHMPGHKRRSWGELPEAMYRMDITEIEGFDNLHQPEGILKELQKEAARLYGAEESYYLVNGSTCGILSAVSSAIPFGGHILMARNCHKSAYHAAYLRHLKVSYLYSDCMAAYGIWDAVTPEQVRVALEAEGNIRAVLLVSPTYEGRIADVSGIARIVHERGIPLIVDEAHGAHLGLAEGFPENSCQAGADLVIHSVHKTLPALTQTALLHVNGHLVNRDRLRRFLRIYQSSSPSYLLMAGIDNALEYVRKQGKAAFGQFRERYIKMTEALKECRCLRILSGSVREQDVGKLVISAGRSGITGKQLSDILLNKYHLQTEMSSISFVLAMFTLNDGEEAYQRMTEALLEIDDRLTKRNADGIFPQGDASCAEDSSDRGGQTKEAQVREIEAKEAQIRETSEMDVQAGEPSAENRKPIPLWEAWDMEAEEIVLKDSIGRYAAEFVNLYPPGVPLLVPGERMTEGLYREILRDLEAGLTIQGIRVGAGKGCFPDGIFIKMITESALQGSISQFVKKKEEQNMRKTKIICTIGPASDTVERLRELMLAGMNVARFNFSHGTHEEQKAKLEKVRQASAELGLPVATMLDTKGPEIRLRDFEGGRAELEAGQQFTLTTEEILGTAERASISYKNLKNDIQEGTTILIDDGLIEMTVEEIRGEEIVCRVVNGGAVSNHKGVNVPGAVLSMPYISETDRSDILFGIEMGYELLAASFVRCREDVLEIRSILDAHGSDMKVISKIENMQGIQNLEEILEVSDGIMVARGDMGVEIPLEEVPVLQKKMIQMANARGKCVITATQMLESMIKNPRPTRAEATDIANAIYDGTTAIMLSGESAAGKYPVEAVKTMARIAEGAEKDIDYGSRMKRGTREGEADITTAIAYATCTAARDLHAAAIITVTLSGFTAEAISRFKPESPIIGCTVRERVCRRLNILWGVNPLMIPEESTADELFEDAVSEAKKAGYVKEGDVVVITAGVPLGKAGTTNMIHVVEVS